MWEQLEKVAAPADDWERAVARERVLRRLAQNARNTPVEIAAACRELSVRRARLYQLLKHYRADPVTSALLTRPSGMAPGTRRLSHDLEAVIGEAIAAVYATRQRASVRAAHLEARRLSRLKGLKPPSYHAVAARIASWDAEDLARAREGARAVQVRFRATPGHYAAAYAYEVVQIDHTLVDAIVVDARERRPLQRPWLTLAIDVASRMVAGYHLTLEPPSTSSVALAIQHLALPKTTPPRRLDRMPDWPAAGLPDVIHVDNAKEFRSAALRRGAQEHGMELLFRPVRTPRYGGHIERLIGTMMGQVHLLPGTTFGSVAERAEYDSARHAAMTFDEFEAWLVLEIARYHADRHAGLGLPPRLAWDEAVARRPAPLRSPHDQAAFVLDFLPSVTRMLRRDGLHLFGLRYWDDVLSLWLGRLRRPLRVIYDPRDLSTVQVRGPDGLVHAVRFADLRRPPITLAEHRAAQAELRVRGAAAVDEELIFATIMRQRALIDDAVGATRRARRQGERRQRALLDASGPDRCEGEAHEAAADDQAPIELPFYEVEEWDEPPPHRR